MSIKYLGKYRVNEMNNQIMNSQIVSYNRSKHERRSDAELKALAVSYDFKKTNRFPKESMYILESVYSNYARLLTNTLSARLGSQINVQIESISQMKYIDYTLQNLNDGVTSVFTMEPLQGSFFLNIHNSLAFMCIDSICGGSIGYKPINREYTEIEKKLLSILIGYFLDPLKKSWQDYIKLSPTFKSLEFNLFNLQYIGDDESIAAVDITIQVGENNYYPISYILPYRSIESILENFSKIINPDQQTVSPTKESMASIENQLKSSEIEMKVILGKTNLEISKISQLKVGEVIPLTSKVNDLLPLVTEDSTYFYVQPGMCSNKLAVQVVEILNEMAKGD